MVVMMMTMDSMATRMVSKVDCIKFPNPSISVLSFNGQSLGWLISSLILCFRLFWNCCAFMRHTIIASYAT